MIENHRLSAIPLHPEMVAFDALLQVLRDIMHGIRMEEPLFDRSFDCRGKGVGAVGANFSRMVVFLTQNS